MKKTVIIFCLLFAGYVGFAQVLTPEEASKRVGDSIKVCGKIFGGRFFETSVNCPTLLNMGASYPTSPLTIMIPGDVRMKMDYAPEQRLKDKTVCVTGRVILFKEKPEIVVYNISQLEVQ